MADLWSNVGSSLPPPGDDWLYQKGGQVHGPLPKEQIVRKLISGELDPKTKVAREGGEFHPVSQIAAFSPHLEEVRSALNKKGAAKVRKGLFFVFVLMAAAGGAGFYYFKMEAEAKGKRDAILAEEQAAKRAEEAKLRKELLNKDVELVALVSFDEKAMTVGKDKPAKKPSSRPSGGKKPQEEKEPEFVDQCKRGPAEIFGVLRKNLAKINFCVEDEKGRDKTGSLPAELKLSFVATPGGSVSDFEILDRHYKTGPMRNCMLKAFRLIKFNSTTGTNCPVTIPIKIGG